ncbi:MAG: hypothetical protein JWN04_73 [Myxococcaceae bacterium]|nr:hypothetical protein [Myxococcaceae bacterium]
MLLVGTASVHKASADAVQPRRAHVEDHAALLPPIARKQLESMLAAYESRTGHQLVFVSVNSLGGASIEDLGMRAASTWKLGRKGIDDGLLVLVTKQERRSRIEVGYGLEGVLPDALAARLLRETLEPAYRDAAFASGTRALFRRLLSAADGAVERADETTLLGPEGLAMQGAVSDRARLLSSELTQQMTQKLVDARHVTGWNLGVLTVACPSEARWDQCVEAVMAFWSAARTTPLDGLTGWIVRSGANASMETWGLREGVPFTLVWPELAVPSTLPTRADPVASIEAATRRLVERAGARWETPRPKGARRVESRSTSPGLVWGALLALIAPLAALWYFARRALGKPLLALDGLQASSELEPSRSSDAHATSTDDDDGATLEGGGGKFGGGGASGQW